MIGHDSRVYVWRKKDEDWRPDPVTPRQSKPCYEVMIWGCVAWEGVGTVTAVNGNINAEKYQEILDKNLWPVGSRQFPAGNYLFQQDDALVHRARSTHHFLHRNNINYHIKLTSKEPRLKYHLKSVASDQEKASDTGREDRE